MRLAVAASAAYPDLRPDWPLLQAALADRGVVATTQVWTDLHVEWQDFDLVVANGAWDNIHRAAEFSAWVETVSGETMLVNPPSVLRWNMDKRYLAALAEAGVPTVPTLWMAPGDPRPDLFEGEIVVKPTISGGGYETARYRPDEHEQARVHIDRLHEAGRTVMLQPYQFDVDRIGEVGLIFLGGEYSHAISKSPLLRAGAGVQEHLWQDGHIGPALPTTDQRRTAQAALRVAEHVLEPTTYARVDLVPLDDGTSAVLELELLDPALFFEHDPPAADRFAAVLAASIAGR